MVNHADTPITFRRFHAPDPDTLQQCNVTDLLKLADAQRCQALKSELEISSRVGTGLYIAGDEAKAAPILERAVEIARILYDQDSEIFALFNLATAKQYLDERDLAQALFVEALELSRRTGIDKFDHYILHHQGRCFVEQGEIDKARSCFQNALAIRTRIGDPRAASSQAALDELAICRD